jgi:DUF438 domain-containing protein
MTDGDLAIAILDSVPARIVYADTEHMVRYMNAVALRHYRQGAGLIGTSLLDCHNEASCELMREGLEQLRAGADEVLSAEVPGRRSFMRAVRDAEGGLLGYWARYEEWSVEEAG